MALDSAERLARVRHLLAGLPGPYGNEHLWTLIGFASGENPFTNVFAFLNACDVIDPASSFGGAPQAPQDAEELAARMAEVNQDAAFAVLVGMTSRTLAYRVRGRYPVHNAEAVYEKLIMLLGHGTCTTGNPAGRAEQALRKSPVHEGFISRAALIAEAEGYVDCRTPVPYQSTDGRLAVARFSPPLSCSAPSPTTSG